MHVLYIQYGTGENRNLRRQMHRQSNYRDQLFAAVRLMPRTCQQDAAAIGRQISLRDRFPSCPLDFTASDAAISVALSSAASKNVMEKTKIAFLRRKSLVSK